MITAYDAYLEKVASKWDKLVAAGALSANSMQRIAVDASQGFMRRGLYERVAAPADRLDKHLARIGLQHRRSGQGLTLASLIEDAPRADYSQKADRHGLGGKPQRFQRPDEMYRGGIGNFGAGPVGNGEPT